MKKRKWFTISINSLLSLSVVEYEGCASDPEDHNWFTALQALGMYTSHVESEWPFKTTVLEVTIVQIFCKYTIY